MPQTPKPKDDPYAGIAEDPYAGIAEDATATGVPAVAAPAAAAPAPTYSGESVDAIKGLMRMFINLPQAVLTPHETFGATREQEVKMGPTGRLIYNVPADVTQSLLEAEAARKAAAARGEGGAAQTLAFLENSLAAPFVKKWEEAGPGYAKFSPQTLGGTIGAVGAIEGPKAVAALPGAVTEAVSGPFARRVAMAPREVAIAGEKVPVLVGEAEPKSFWGRVQTELKRAGVGEQRFKNLSDTQQAAVKQVIRNVAQQTSGMEGPMREEPGPAMKDAADATFDKARPMYQEMDKALVSIPDSMGTVSKVVEQAIARAEKLGAKITRGEPEEVWVSGQKYTPQNNPRAWELLKKQGLIPAQTGQPLESYMKVRSELLKMQRGSSDAAMRYSLGNEITAMNDAMEQAMQGTPLWDSWNQANRLWAKGYAIRDVADVLRKVTSGTPTEGQAPELAKTPTKIKGTLLVSRLNELKANGVLDRAFTPEEVKNLQQSADILDRARSAAGREFGYGYGWHSTIMRNLVKLPAYPLVRAMTTPAGAMALRFGDLNTFAQVAGVKLEGVGRTVRRAGVSAAASERKPQSPQQELDRALEDRRIELQTAREREARKRKSPGQQIRDLRKIQERHSDNPHMPIGPEP